MASVLAFASRNWQAAHQTAAVKTPDALKFGLLGAANVAPTALFGPAKTHPEVVIQAVAARDKKKAEAYAKKYSIPQVFEGYDAMLDDPTIDAVYIALPAALHHEWVMKAIEKGKHVLLEKPAVVNATEAESLFRSPLLQGPKSPVVLEAMHFRFQPTWAHFVSLIDPANLLSVTCTTTLPSYMIPKDSFRFDYDLGGGNILDVGTYAFYALRHVTGTEPEECMECVVRTRPPPRERCDEAADVTFRFPGGVVGKAITALRASVLSIPTFDITAVHKEVALEDSGLPDGQKKFRVRKLTLHNFLASAVEHCIDTEDELVIRATNGDKVVKRWTEKRSKKVFTFKDAGIDQLGAESVWNSYRHQLEQFVNRIRGREGSGLWVGCEDSLAQARMIDMAYTKSGLPLRCSRGPISSPGAHIP